MSAERLSMLSVDICSLHWAENALLLHCRSSQPQQRELDEYDEEYDRGRTKKVRIERCRSRRPVTLRPVGSAQSCREWSPDTVSA